MEPPVRIAFFPAISISLLLLAAALLEPMPQRARAVWLLGTALQGILALSVISAWIGHRAFQQVQSTTAWFIPAVGNVIVPLADARLGHVEISWLYFFRWADLLGRSADACDEPVDVSRPLAGQDGADAASWFLRFDMF